MATIVWKFQPGALPSAEKRRLPPELEARLLRDVVVERGPAPVFSEDIQDLERLAGDRARDLLDHYLVRVDDEDQAGALTQRLRQEASVAQVEIQGEPIEDLPVTDQVPRFERDAVQNDPSRPLHQFQLYLRPGANGTVDSGVDARFAWGVQGGRGEEVQLVVIGNYWSLSHEDLSGVQALDAEPGGNHDIAALGICCGESGNGIGIHGIAHRAWGGIARPINAGGMMTPAGAITRVVTGFGLGRGDVILLEWQDPSRLPVERLIGVPQAIRAATDLGIHVVEPAGNGNHELTVNGDPGAILVSAGNPLDRSRAASSNYGAAVHVQGWGESVVTSGGRAFPVYHDLQSRTRPESCYTQSFNGTSSAAAVVAGVVACLSGVLKAHGLSRSPRDMRQLLIANGVAQAAIARHLGPLPNLRGALEALEQEKIQGVDGVGFRAHSDPQPPS